MQKMLRYAGVFTLVLSLAMAWSASPALAGAPDFEETFNPDSGMIKAKPIDGGKAPQGFWTVFVGYEGEQYYDYSSEYGAWKQFKHKIPNWEDAPAGRYYVSVTFHDWIGGEDVVIDEQSWIVDKK